jgi:hypothetical protein
LVGISIGCSIRFFEHWLTAGAVDVYGIANLTVNGLVIREFGSSVRSGYAPEMQHQNPMHLVGGLDCVVDEVVVADHEFGMGPIEVGTVIGDDAVGPEPGGA